MEKCITNQTNFDITVTLHIAEIIDDIFQATETRTIEIKSNGIKAVAYKGRISSFISGIDVSADINGNTLKTSHKSGSAESPLCLEMNNSHAIEIKGLRTLDIELIN